VDKAKLIFQVHEKGKQMLQQSTKTEKEPQMLQSLIHVITTAALNKSPLSRFLNQCSSSLLGNSLTCTSEKAVQE